MSSVENSNQANFPSIPEVGTDGHIANPNEWLLGIAKEQGLDMAEMALERAGRQGLLGYGAAREPRHRSEGAADNTPYIDPPKGSHVALPTWQMTALEEDKRLRDEAPTYAKPRSRAIDQDDEVYAFRGGDRKILREQLSAAEIPSVETIRSAGTSALRESYTQFLATQQMPTLDVIIAKNAAAAPPTAHEVEAQERRISTKPVTRRDLLNNERARAELAELKKPQLARALSRITANILTRYPGHK